MSDLNKKQNQFYFGMSESNQPKKKSTDDYLSVDMFIPERRKNSGSSFDSTRNVGVDNKKEQPFEQKTSYSTPKTTDESGTTTKKFNGYIDSLINGGKPGYPDRYKIGSNPAPTGTVSDLFKNPFDAFTSEQKPKKEKNPFFPAREQKKNSSLINITHLRLMNLGKIGGLIC